MIKRATVTIPYVVWNEGQPRFVPGPALRAAGYTSFNMQAQDGTWFTFEQAAKESDRIRAEAKARKASAAPAPATQRVFATPVGATLGQCCEANLEALEAITGRDLVDGKKVQKGMSRVTLAGYQKSARAVQQACRRMALAHPKAGDTWDLPVNLIGPERMGKLLNDVWVNSGLHQVRAVRAYLSQMWSRTASKEQGVDKFIFTQLDKLPMPEGRVRPWEPLEFWHMVETAEAMGLPDMADSFFWGVLHGHRQTDRLDPVVTSITGTHITLQQSKGRKRNVTVTLLMDAVLQQRQAASAKRREKHKVHWPHLLIDETAQQPWHPSGDHYRKVFGRVRDKASETMAGCATLRDQDLRDTNMTWLDRASVDPQIMALMAGHSVRARDNTKIQKRHYVAFNQIQADASVRAISAYMLAHKPEEKKEIEQL